MQLIPRNIQVSLNILQDLYQAHPLPVSGETLASRLGEPGPYIKGVAASLAAAGLVAPSRGPGGGYTIAEGVPTNSLGAVFKALGRQYAYNPLSGPNCASNRVLAMLGHMLDTLELSNFIGGPND